MIAAFVGMIHINAHLLRCIIVQQVSNKAAGVAVAVSVAAVVAALVEAALEKEQRSDYHTMV